MTSWVPMLRLARRDARRHLQRTIAASLLIALPVAALTVFASVSNPGMPLRERALASIPEGAQALITAAALPREDAPFPQLPEGAPGPWMDDPDVVATSDLDVRSVLSADTTLAEYWISPSLIASPDFPLAAGEQVRVSDFANKLGQAGMSSLTMVELRESEAGAFELQAPLPVKGDLPSGDDEVLVSTTVAERLSLAVGDTLSFVAPPDSGWRSSDGNSAAAMEDSARGYRVSGIAHSEDSAAWSRSGWLSRLVADNPAGVQRHWLALGEDPVTWAEARELNELQVFAISRHVLENYPSADQLYPVASDPAAIVESILGVVLALFVGISLVVFLVTPALAVSAEQSRRTLGLAAAAGASPTDLRRMVLAQGLVLGIIGGLAGSILGIGGALGLAAWIGAMELRERATNPRFGLEVTIAHFPWWALLVGLVMAVVLGAVAAMGPARFAAKLNPVDALRDRVPATHESTTRRMSLFLGLGLVLLSAGLGTVSLFLPIPPWPSASGGYYVSPRSLPPGSTLLIVTVIVTVVTAAVGIVLLVRGVVPLLGRVGRRSRPAWRLALRDAADHPSRTVPAILGVTFSLLAASYLLVLGASTRADGRMTSETFDWQGTFMVSPAVEVDPDFDRALAAAALRQISQEVPEISGAFPVEAIDSKSQLRMEAILPEGRECPLGQDISAGSAREIGAPVTCIDQNSGAVFHSGIRLGGVLSTWQPPVLLSGDAIRATRLPDAEAAAEILEAGGVLTSNAAFIDEDGTIRIGLWAGEDNSSSGDNSEKEALLPAGFLRGMGVGLMMSPETARNLGIENLSFVGLLAQTDTPLDVVTLSHLSESGAESSDAGNLVSIAIPDSADPLGATPDPVSRLLTWAPSAVLALVAVAAAAVSVLLSVTQSRRDAITAYAIGAPRSLLFRWALARAGVILGLGVPLGIGAGIGLGAYQVAWNRHLQASGAWLDTVVVWPVQGIIAAGVVAAGLVAALVLAKPPRNLVRRSLD